MSRCTICGRRSVHERPLCRYHSAAYDIIERKFNEWKCATGCSWTEYIDELLEMEETGIWVRDVLDWIKSQSDS